MSKNKLVSKEVAKEIREKAKPIIDWLRTAEEESSDSEDEDDDGKMMSLQPYSLQVLY